MNDLKLFFRSQRNVAVATNFVGKIDRLPSSNPHLVVRVTFVRAAPKGDKKVNCYTGRRQTNYLIRWTQENQLSDKLTIIYRLWATVRLRLHLVVIVLI